MTNVSKTLSLTQWRLVAIRDGVITADFPPQPESHLWNFAIDGDVWVGDEPLLHHSYMQRRVGWEVTDCRYLGLDEWFVNSAPMFGVIYTFSVAVTHAVDQDAARYFLEQLRVHSRSRQV